MTPAEVKQLVEMLEKMFQTAVDRAENCRDNECFQDAIDYEIEARDVSRAASALTLLAQEREELREALRDIADERGVCGTCGTIATGPAGGVTACGCASPVWHRRDPKDVARAALKDT